MKTHKTTALIMAGGKGERFWPRSRKNLPKQFLSITGSGKTMIQLTVDRLLPMIPIDDIYISTNEDYSCLVAEQLPELPKKNIIVEPVGRNTAPCIGLGAIYIQKKYEDAIMLVLPSDHDIADQEAFRAALMEVCDIAEQGENLVTIGIRPVFPETGYGYIKYCSSCKLGNGYKVDRFVEKPILEKAKEYLASGQYLWNSGMFGWKISTLLKNMQLYMPDNYRRLMTIQEAIDSPEEQDILRTEFSQMDSQSIDYGVMEKAESIYTVPGSFGWDDVGSWLAVERLQSPDERGNALHGDVVNVDTNNCIIQGNRKLIATVGLNGLVIVDTEDALLILDKEKAGDIKKVLQLLRDSGRDALL